MCNGTASKFRGGCHIAQPKKIQGVCLTLNPCIHVSKSGGGSSIAMEEHGPAIPVIKLPPWVEGQQWQGRGRKRKPGWELGCQGAESKQRRSPSQECGKGVGGSIIYEPKSQFSREYSIRSSGFTYKKQRPNY